MGTKEPKKISAQYQAILDLEERLARIRRESLEAMEHVRITTEDAHAEIRRAKAAEVAMCRLSAEDQETTFKLNTLKAMFNGW